MVSWLQVPGTQKTVFGFWIADSGELLPDSWRFQSGVSSSTNLAMAMLASIASPPQLGTQVSAVTGLCGSGDRLALVAEEAGLAVAVHFDIEALFVEGSMVVAA